MGFWLFGLAVTIAILYWNWKLFLATSVGVLIMWLVYRLQAWDWQMYWSKLRRLFGGANRQLTIAVGSGGLATIGTYTAVSIGVDANSAWIAAGAMLQSLTTLAILVLLVWQMFGRQAVREEVKLERMLDDLTDADPLKRSIAVRYLTRWATKGDKANQYAIGDYFRLMLDREREPTIRAAVLEALETFNKVQKLSGGDVPFSMPIDFKRSAIESHPGISEKF